MQGMQSTPGQPGTAPAARFSATIFRPLSRGLGRAPAPVARMQRVSAISGAKPPRDCAGAIPATGLNLAVVRPASCGRRAITPEKGYNRSRERPERAGRRISAGDAGDRTCHGRAGRGSSSADVCSQRKPTCARKAAILVLPALGHWRTDQNGRRSALNGRKASSSGLRGCPWLRTACFAGLLGFSAAGVSVGSGAGAVNSEATGEAGSLDVASADGDSPPDTASRPLGAPSLPGSSTAGGGGTTVEGAAAGAIASTTL
jgi:hypothetical protein